MCVMCLKNRMGYLIIPKPIFSSREGINSGCRRFDLSPCFFAIFTQSVIAVTAVVAVQVVAVSTCH